MTAELIPFPVEPSVDQLIDTALATCPSHETRRMYGVQLRKFVASGQPLTREGVAKFLQTQYDAGLGAATITSCISAIRKLVTEAHVRGLMSDADSYAIHALKVPKAPRSRLGSWLTLEQVEELLALPDRSTYLGKRDAAMLSVMIGCGLRRAETSQVRWASYDKRDGRRVLADLKGKGGKYRTVPVPAWAAADVDAWRDATLTERPERRDAVRPSFRPDPLLMFEGVGTASIYKSLCRYSRRLGVKIAPHDLRRTLAKLLRASGAQLEQIQHTLGHAKLETTTRYLGTELELREGAAAIDRLRITAANASKFAKAAHAGEVESPRAQEATDGQ